MTEPKMAAPTYFAVRRLQGIHEPQDTVPARNILINEVDADYESWQEISECPIMGLPNEVICIIFTYVRAPRDSYGSKYMSLKYSQEITVSHVCQRWRSIALAEQRLWSTIRYRPNELTRTTQRLSEDHQEALMGRILAYLQRSGDRPLDIWVSLLPADRASFSFNHSIVKILKAHSRRWRTFALDAPAVRGNQPSVAALLGDIDAPQLRSLQISSMCSPWSSDIPKCHPTIIYGMPALTHFRTTPTLYRRFFPSPSTITTLHIDGDLDECYSWPFLLEILGSRTLTNLSIANSAFVAPDTKWTCKQIVTAPNLKHLRITDDVVAEYMWLYVRAPVLELLILKKTRPSVFRFEPKEGQILPSSFPSLRTLALVRNNEFDASISEGWVPDFSRALSNATASITNLIITDCDAPPTKFFDDMIHYQPKTILWPELRSFTYISDRIKLGKAGDEDTSGGRCYDEHHRLAGAVMDFVECRARILKKHCVVRLPGAERAKWEVSLPSILASLEEAGHLQFIDRKQLERCVPNAPFNPGGILDREVHAAFTLDTST